MLAVVAVAGLIAVLGVTAIPASGAGHEAEVRIGARLDADGRTEAGLQQHEADGGWSERVLPEARFFPATFAVGQWLRGPLLTVRAAGAGEDAAGTEVRITAQRLADGRTEFALLQRAEDGEWGERLLPQARFFPATSAVGRWLSSTPLAVSVPEVSPDTAEDSGSVASDRAALVALYHATGGATWLTSRNWLSGKAPQSRGTGSPRTDDGRVTELWLWGNNLRGPIPAELGELTKLQTLYLRSNRLTGLVPVELGDLTNLRRLYLGSNQLTGPIPDWLGDLGNLVSLDLRSNRLSGPIPAELGDLTNLRRLYLASNELTGPIPTELGDLTNLESLSLSNNKLTGPIPDWLRDLTNLQTLELGDNKLTGPIPDWLSDLINLESLRLDFNQLTGPIPARLGELANLESLRLDFNQLTGPIPVRLGDSRQAGIAVTLGQPVDRGDPGRAG